jgi:hypothetical protein
VEDDKRAVGLVPTRGGVGIVGELDGLRVGKGRTGGMPSLRHAGQPWGRDDRAETALALEARDAGWRRAGSEPNDNEQGSRAACMMRFRRESMSECRGRKDSLQRSKWRRGSNWQRSGRQPLDSHSHSVRKQDLDSLRALKRALA